MKTLLTIAALTLTACAGNSTGVIPMDMDSFMIAKAASHGPGRSLENKAQVYREANEFCGNKGQQVQTVHEASTFGLPFKPSENELQFRCVPTGGTAHPLQKESDFVFEMRNR
jgi:hypothetical protein